MREKYKAKVNYLLKKKSIEIENLQEVAQNAEQTLAKMKEELAMEIERREKAEAEIVEKERQISKAKEQAILDFKTSKELEDIKIDFAKEAFIRGFELYQRKVVEIFHELDLSFLAGESSNEEAKPSTTSIDLPTKLAVVTFEPIEDVLTLSAAPPPEVGDF